MSLRFLMDHHVHGAITAGLRNRGIDVVTAHEHGSASTEDEGLLRRAQMLDRVLFTFDDDLLAIAARFRSSGVPFAGLVFCRAQEFSIGRVIDDLELIARAVSPTDIRHQIIWVPI